MGWKYIYMVSFDSFEASFNPKQICFADTSPTRASLMDMNWVFGLNASSDLPDGDHVALQWNVTVIDELCEK